MTNPTLAELYATHTGKVSDKWSSYLPNYDRLFRGLRDRPIRLMEIGVQNGGSLEIWAKYFTHPNSKILGVDINRECLNLRYTDTRIWVAHGDATKELDYIKTEYDIIIDDGSHKPEDQMQSFDSWWPQIKDGGIYVVEDLHCPDCLAFVYYLRSLVEDLAIDEKPTLPNIARIEFMNSMIAIVKGDSSLGPRVVAGQIEAVAGGHLGMNGTFRHG